MTSEQDSNTRSDSNELLSEEAPLEQTPPGDRGQSTESTPGSQIERSSNVANSNLGDMEPEPWPESSSPRCGLKSGPLRLSHVKLYCI